MHVDDREKAIAAMVKYAEDTFHGVRTSTDVYARIVIAFNAVSDDLKRQALMGLVTPELAESWSWYSLAVPAMLQVALLGSPKWGTRELEVQLLESFKTSLRTSKQTTVNHTGAGKDTAIPAVLVPAGKTDPGDQSH